MSSLMSHTRSFPLLIGLILLAGVGCSSLLDGGDEEQPIVRGAIESMQHSATASALLVRAGPGSLEPCGISATVDAETVYKRRVGGALGDASVADLAVGDTVEVYVDGPIAESCPVQGRASRIVEVVPAGGL